MDSMLAISVLSDRKASLNRQISSVGTWDGIVPDDAEVLKQLVDELDRAIETLWDVRAHGAHPSSFDWDGLNWSESDSKLAAVTSCDVEHVAIKRRRQAAKGAK